MMSKAFRCDDCGDLVEDEVAALYPSLLAGYASGSRTVRIQVSNTVKNADYCQACVGKLAAAFLNERSSKTGKAP